MYYHLLGFCVFIALLSAFFDPRTQKNKVESVSDKNVILDNGFDDVTVVNGLANLRNQSFTALLVNGAASIYGVTVLQGTIINGSAYLEHSRFKDLEINGSADCTTIWVDRVISVNGSARFKKSQLNIMYIRGNQCDLIDTRVNGHIWVMSVQNGLGNTKEHILLVDTIVDGDIIFESKQGTVELQGTSKVLGNVIGGSVF